MLCTGEEPWGRDRLNFTAASLPLHSDAIAAALRSGRSVHLWSVRTDASEDIASSFNQLLSPDERDRAARFRFDYLRRSFAVARGTLRIILGVYLGAPAETLRFAYGAYGKPALDPGAGIQFNASHSGDRAIFAVTSGRELGVDIEQWRPMQDRQQVASRFFCAAEAEELLSLPSGQQQRAFFNCWTRKEAYIKATGEGLSAGLDSFRVSLDPAKPATLIHIAGSMEAALAWTLHDLETAPGYAAALAYRDAERSITAFPGLEPADLLRLPNESRGCCSPASSKCPNSD